MVSAIYKLAVEYVSGTRAWKSKRWGRPWKRKQIDDVTFNRPEGEGDTPGGTQTGKRPPCLRPFHEESRRGGPRLTVTVARRESGEPLTESFEMRTVYNFVGKRITHAFRWGRCKIRIQVVTVVGRHLRDNRWMCVVCSGGGDYSNDQTNDAAALTPLRGRWPTNRRTWRATADYGTQCYHPGR